MCTSWRLLLALILLLPGIPTWADTPSLFIAGDSTASNGAENGWGSHLQKFFDPSQLTVINRARGGRSSRTFITEGLWDGIVADLKALESCPVTQFLNAEGQRITPYAPHIILNQVEEWMTAPWMPNVQPVSNPSLPTLYVIGDSTVRNGRLGDGSNGQWGWGAPIADYFDRSRINVENHAMGGTSSRTYRSLGLWDEVLQKIKPGDYVIVQFGHNDSSPINDDSRARGTIRSNGNEVEEIDNLLTGEHEIVHSYGWYLRQFIAETRSKGATALVCSPIPRNNFNKAGRLPRADKDWGLWAMQAAREAGGYFIDLNERIAIIFEELGANRVGSLYYTSADHTHTSAAGAMFNARRVMEGIKDLANCDLANYLKVVTPH